jgi:hypothetical protein
MTATPVKEKKPKAPVIKTFPYSFPESLSDSTALPSITNTVNNEINLPLAQGLPANLRLNGSELRGVEIKIKSGMSASNITGETIILPILATGEVNTNAEEEIGKALGKTEMLNALIKTLSAKLYSSTGADLSAYIQAFSGNSNIMSNQGSIAITPTKNGLGIVVSTVYSSVIDNRDRENPNIISSENAVNQIAEITTVFELKKLGTKPNEAPKFVLQPIQQILQINDAKFLDFIPKTGYTETPQKLLADKIKDQKSLEKFLQKLKKEKDSSDAELTTFLKNLKTYASGIGQKSYATLLEKLLQAKSKKEEVEFILNLALEQPQRTIESKFRDLLKSSTTQFLLSLRKNPNDPEQIKLRQILISYKKTAELLEQKPLIAGLDALLEVSGIPLNDGERITTKSYYSILATLLSYATAEEKSSIWKDFVVTPLIFLVEKQTINGEKAITLLQFSAVAPELANILINDDNNLTFNEQELIKIAELAVDEVKTRQEKADAPIPIGEALFSPKAKITLKKVQDSLTNNLKTLKTAEHTATLDDLDAVSQKKTHIGKLITELDRIQNGIIDARTHQTAPPTKQQDVMKAARSSGAPAPVLSHPDDLLNLKSSNDLKHKAPASTDSAAITADEHKPGPSDQI